MKTIRFKSQGKRTVWSLKDYRAATAELEPLWPSKKESN
jgi:hypothetical protein